MSKATVVRGFHGTSSENVRKILSEGFKPSRNKYDWLGDGVYFFQDAPERAWDWAKKMYTDKASVVCSEIRLENCMDFLDIQWSGVLADVYDSFLTEMKRAKIPLPTQSSGAHRLDREVINYAVGILAKRNIKISCVRAVFKEGRPIFPNSALFTLDHIQIAVRDTILIERSWEIVKGDRNVIKS